MSGSIIGIPSISSNQESQAAMDETFYLSNISPQVGSGFNRDYWARLEAFIRSLTYVISEKSVDDHLVGVSGRVCVHWPVVGTSKGKGRQLLRQVSRHWQSTQCFSAHALLQGALAAV